MMMLELRCCSCWCFGWIVLFGWVFFGFVLEVMYGFKVGVYFDDVLICEFLVFVHVHGVGLVLVVLVFGEVGVLFFGEVSDRGVTCVL